MDRRTDRTKSRDAVASKKYEYKLYVSAECGWGLHACKFTAVIKCKFKDQNFENS